MTLLEGPHRVLIELVNANHKVLDNGEVTFMVPEEGDGEEGGVRQ